MIVIQNANLFAINILNALKLAAGLSRKKGRIKLESHLLSLTFVVEYLFYINDVDVSWSHCREAQAVKNSKYSTQT